MFKHGEFSMPLTSLVCILFMVGSVSWLLWSYFSYKIHVARLSKALPDGPRPLPWIGNEPEIRGINYRVTETLKSLTKYGDIVTVWLSRTPVLVINSPRAAHDLMHTMSAKTADRPLTVHYRARLLPWSLVLAPYGEQCHRLRKIYHHILGQKGEAIFRKWSEEETLFMLKTLAERPDQAHFECDRHGFNITMRIIYGVRYGPEGDHKVRETFQLWEKMFCYFLPGSLIFDYFPALLELAEWLQPWLFTFQGLKRRERRIHDEHLRMIANYGGHLGKTLEDGATTFAEQLLQVTEGMGLGEQAIIDVLSMLLGAGADTISGFMQQFFKAMALNPEAMIQAQAEIDSVVGSSRLPTWDDQSKLPYLRSLIKEVHRWAPFAAAGIPHSTTEEIMYQNYVIPKGTVLIPNIPALTRSDERYVEPNKFDPSRFLDDDSDSATSAHNPDWSQRDHVHFGWGRRLCPGVHAADICIFLAVSRVLWGFSIQPHPDYQVRMEDVSGGLLKKPLPFRLHIISRGQRYEEVVEQRLALHDAENKGSRLTNFRQLGGR